MHRQETEVSISALTLMFIIVWIIFVMSLATSFGIKNIRHRETIEIYEEVIEIYEEYYILDEEMDLIYRVWLDWYQSYGEEQYYLEFHQEKYLRYLKLKKIIGEIEK